MVARALASCSLALVLACNSFTSQTTCETTSETLSCPRILNDYCAAGSDSAACPRSWAEALLFAQKDVCGGRVWGLSTSEGCGGYDVLYVSHEDLGTAYYYATDTHELVTTVEWGLTSDACVGGPAVFTRPACPGTPVSCATGTGGK